MRGGRTINKSSSNDPGRTGQASLVVAELVSKTGTHRKQDDSRFQSAAKSSLMLSMKNCTSASNVLKQKLIMMMMINNRQEVLWIFTCREKCE